MRKLLFIPLIVSLTALGQSKEEEVIRSIFDEALVNGQSYQMLDYLSNEIGSRLTGSPGAAAAGRAASAGSASGYTTDRAPGR